MGKSYSRCQLVKVSITWSSLKSFITGRSTIWLFTNFHLFFSSKSRSSFLDSSASFKPVINGKRIVNTKTHRELSQLVIVSQNFNSFNRINIDSIARPAPLSRLELHVRKSFFDRTKICNLVYDFHDFLCLMLSPRSKPAFLPPRNGQQLLSLGYITKICSSLTRIK